MTEENSSMDWSACLYYLRDKRRFDYFDGTAIQGCTECLQISHPLTNPCLSCHRNFKCRPWRRKSILNSVPKWSWLSLLPLATLFLLLTNIVQGVFHVLSRTNHLNKRLKLRPVAWGLLFVILFGANCLPLVSCQESLQPTPSFKSQHLPNAVVYVGSAFIYNISENAFDCEVDSIVVSETADRFLSNWLAYDSHKKQLYGVPTDKDEGMYNILVVALTKDGRDSGHVCGSRSFFIKVVPVSEEFPVSVYPGAQTSSKENKSVQSLPCVPGTQVVQGTVILNADMHSLNGHERMVLVLKMADHLNMHSSRVSLFSGQTSHPIIGQLDNPTVVAAGAGDGRFAKGSRSLLTWHASCGAVKLENLALSKLEAAAQDGTISSLLGVPVVGWHVMSGAQKGRTRHRVRRQVIGVTATPMTDIVPPSRMSNISTSIIISRTVTLTSVFIRNSSIQLSTSVLSSVAPNRTDASSPSTGLTSTVSSQPINRTDILSSSINNVTSSTMGISPSSIHFTKTLVVNSSSVVLSRNMTVSIKSSTLLSSINRTTLIRSSSVLPPSLNSTFITRTATSYVSSSVISTLLLSTSRTQNSSSIALSPNETTAFASGLVTVPSVNSTGLTTSSTFTTSLLNQTLSPSTAQVNRSSEVMRTSSSFAVSSSTPTPIISSSSFLSIASPSLITPQSISRTISSLQLNATTSTSMSPTLTRSTKLTPTLNISSSFAVSANSSVLITSAVNQTFVSTRIQASNSSSMFSSSVTMSSSSSLETLPNTTTVIVGNASSSLVVSSGPRSSPMVSTPLQNRTSATPMSTPSPSIVPTLSSIISTLNTTVQTVSSTVMNTSSLVSPSFKSSVTVLSSSVFLPTSPVLSSSSSVRVNVSTVNRNFTSSSLQPNVTSTAVILSTSPVLSSSTSVRVNVSTVNRNFTSSSLQPNVTSTAVILSTSPVLSSSSSVRVNVSTVNKNFTSSSLQPNVTSTAVILSSFTASPVVTSLNVTSMVISVNASTSKFNSAYFRNLFNRVIFNN